MSAISTQNFTLRLRTEVRRHEPHTWGVQQRNERLQATRVDDRLGRFGCSGARRLSTGKEAEQVDGAFTELTSPA